MTWLRVSSARVFALFHKDRLEAEINEELRFHLAMRTAENIRAGMPLPEASRAANRRLGNVNLIKDACRDVSGAGTLETVWQDLRFAARMLMKDGRFTAVAVIALALGIGSNTALFTVMSNVLLRPLPYFESDRIMSIWSAEADGGPDIFAVSYPTFADFRAQNHLFAQVAAFQPVSFALAVAERDPVQVQGAHVTSDMLPLLGVEPALGRVFTAADDETGSRVVIISHQLWREQFGSAPDILDRALVLDGRESSIIGVMPPAFRFPIQNEPAQLWTSFATCRQPYPYAAAFHVDNGDGDDLLISGLAVLGRLLPGRTPAEAREDLAAIAQKAAVKFPAAHQRLVSAAVVPWLGELTRSVRPALLMLIGAALCVLAVACVNIANLLLARASTREKEMAIRSALGAGRRRILRQLLTESLLLAAAGGAAGSLLAFWGTRYLVSVLPPNFPRAAEIAPDLKVLAFTLGVTVLTSCLFGFGPAWRSAQHDLGPLLRDGSRSASQTPNGRRARSGLVVAELVLAFVLLTAACGLLRTLWQLQTAAPGFNPEDLLTINVSLPERTGVDGRLHSARFYDELLHRVAAHEGIVAASGVYPLPIGLRQPIAPFEIVGHEIRKPNRPLADVHVIAPAYFRTMQIPLLVGREFDDRDRGDAPPVVIINQALAKRYFPGQDPLGNRLKPGFSDSGPPVEREIIAVVGDVKSNSLDVEQPPEVYVPHAQRASLYLTLMIRTTESKETILQAVREASADLDEDVSLHNATTAKEHRAGAIAQPRLNSGLLAAFAAVAVALTAVGIYGVTAYSVAQRRHEIGIRLALGAQRGEIFRLVLGEALRLVGWSILLGSAASVLAAPLLGKFSYGTTGGEASAILLVTMLISAVAIFASWMPARRASAENPLLAIAAR